jgi:hypothetical protein
MIVSARPVLTRGAYRDRHGRGARDAMDVLRPQDGRRAMRTAKSRGPDAPMLASSLLAMISRRRRLTSRYSGESAYKPKTIAQGMPECVRLYLLRTRVLCFAHCPHTRLRVQRHPAFPAPSPCCEGHSDAWLRRNSRREDASVCPDLVIARSEARKQSMLQQAENGLLPPSLDELRRTSRGACHRAALRAGPQRREAV